MEAKKYPTADIDSKRPLIFSFSLAVSLTLIIMAFEWEWKKTELQHLIVLPDDNVISELIEIPPTYQNPVPVPILPPPQSKTTAVLIEIQDNELLAEASESVLDQGTLTESHIEKISITHQPEEKEIGDEIFLIVEAPAQFIGGEVALLKFIKSNLVYPKTAKRMGVEGQVFVKAVIEKDGSVSNAHVIRGISSACDQEAVRVVHSLPKWIPGKQRGRPVRTHIVIPIMFKLREGVATALTF